MADAPGERRRLHDVGADVGMYSIVAANVHGARVFSFEPEGQNFATLNKNIVSNRCGDAITAYCIAILDRLEVDVLNLGQFIIGSAFTCFRRTTSRRAIQGERSVEA